MDKCEGDRNIKTQDWPSVKVVKLQMYIMIEVNLRFLQK